MPSSRRDVLRLIGLGSLGAAVPRAGAERARVELLTVTVAGFRHHDGMRPEVAAALVPGARLAVVPEPTHEADADALALVTADGRRVGYVPRLDNAVPAALARAGAAIHAEVAAFDADAPLQARLRVTLYETR